MKKEKHPVYHALLAFLLLLLLAGILLLLGGAELEKRDPVFLPGRQGARIMME